MRQVAAAIAVENNIDETALLLMVAADVTAAEVMLHIVSWCRLQLGCSRE